MKKKLVLSFIILLILAAIGGYVWLKITQKKVFATMQTAQQQIEAKDFSPALNAVKPLENSYFTRKHKMEVRRLLAQAYLGLGKIPQAKKYLYLLGKSDDTEQVDYANYNMGRLAAEAGNKEQARKYFETTAISAGKNDHTAKALFALAQMDYEKGFYKEARQRLQRILEQYPAIDNMKDVITLYGNTNMKMLFSRAPSLNSEFYIVEPGDILPEIAEKFGMTIDLLSAINGIRHGNIRPGDRIKVVRGTFSVNVDKSDCTLTLKLDGKFFKRYFVGTGKRNSTPVGEFEVTSKLKEPVWYKPGGGIEPFGSKDNLLGTRWMGINYPGYGIHGTWAPETVGKQSSAGCIRLVNEEVEELYNILPPKTKVTIVD